MTSSGEWSTSNKSRNCAKSNATTPCGNCRHCSKSTRTAWALMAMPTRTVPCLRPLPRALRPVLPTRPGARYRLHTHSQIRKTPKSCCSFLPSPYFHVPIKVYVVVGSMVFDRWTTTFSQWQIFQLPNKRLFFIFKRLACFSYGSYGRKPREWDF